MNEKNWLFSTAVPIHIIVAEMKDQIEQAKTEGTASCIVLDAPLLFEVGLEKFCDAVWVVYADAEVRCPESYGTGWCQP